MSFTDYCNIEPIDSSDITRCMISQSGWVILLNITARFCWRHSWRQSMYQAQLIYLRGDRHSKCSTRPRAAKKDLPPGVRFHYLMIQVCEICHYRYFIKIFHIVANDNVYSQKYCRNGHETYGLFIFLLCQRSVREIRTSRLAYIWAQPLYSVQRNFNHWLGEVGG
jgi:hypothetical protein